MSRKMQGWSAATSLLVIVLAQLKCAPLVAGGWPSWLQRLVFSGSSTQSAELQARNNQCGKDAQAAHLHLNEPHFLWQYSPQHPVTPYNASEHRIPTPSYLLFNASAAPSTVITGAGRVIVSLSTIPARIPNIWPVLDALHRQTRPPDVIVLAIPRCSIRERRLYEPLPTFLTDSTFPLLRILWTEHDWGPATKVLPVVAERLVHGDNTSLIIVVDDDHVYDKHTVEQYVRWHEKLPRAALTMRCHQLRPSMDWHVVYAQIIHSYELSDLVQCSIMTAVGTYALAPWMLHAGAWWHMHVPGRPDHDGVRAITRGRNVDDVWISAHVAMSGVLIMAIPGRTKPFVPVNGSLTASQEAFKRDLIVAPWHFVDKQHKTPHLQGGAFADNTWAISYFRNYWQGLGSLDTLAPCMLNSATKQLERMHPDAGCRKPDNSIMRRALRGRLGGTSLPAGCTH